MIVIGDAAHAPAPSSGQGASMALEDGVLLAMALRDRPTIEAAFEAFEAGRRERVERIVAQGARSSSSKTPGRIGSLFRDAFMRLAFRYLITERSLAWMYDHRIDRGAAV
jgi:2-polyprenyl-6-methoxyphenol hydroxylase-like FAD-dependent oxidoreductase